MFILLLLVPLLVGCGFVNNDKEIFGVDTTKSLKGLFASGVVLHHLSSYFFTDRFTTLGLYRHAGFIMVSGFLMISGYGLAFSLQRKDGYLKGFFRKRILPVIVGYYIVAVCYYFLYKHYNMLTPDVFFNLVTGISYWFIVAITVLYIGFWLSFKWLRPKAGLIACTVWTLLYMAFMLILSRRSPYAYGFWWSNSALAFVVGMWFSFYRDKILAVFGNKYVLWTTASALLFAVAYCIAANRPETEFSTFLLQLAASVGFCALVFLLAMKFKVDNFVLRSLGSVSLELYLVQALWIYLIGGGAETTSRALIGILKIVVGSVVTAYAAHYAGRLVMLLINKAHDLIFEHNKNGVSN